MKTKGTKRPHKADVSRQFEATLAAGRRANYLLRLYVTGATPRSTQAIQNIRRICEEHLHGRYQLEVVDVFQRPVLAKGEQIIAAPTLIRLLPLPLRRFIGDMSNTDKILLGLDLRAKQDAETRRRGDTETGAHGDAEKMAPK